MKYLLLALLLFIPIYSQDLRSKVITPSQEPLNPIIDPDTHIFGITFDTTEEEFVKKYGKPIGYISLNSNETVMIYGRKYAFIFNRLKLSGILISSNIIDWKLSSAITEKNPFDQILWKLSNGIREETSLVELKKILGDSLSKENYQYKFTTKNSSVELQLSHYTNEGENDSAYRVYGVLVQKKDSEGRIGSPIRNATPSIIDPDKKIFGFSLTKGPHGHRVTSIFKGSPAEKAGITTGDLVLAIDQNEVSSLSTQQVLAKLNENDSTTLTLKSKKTSERQVSLTKEKQGTFLNSSGFPTISDRTSLSEVEVGDLAPDIDAMDIQNNPIKLSSLKGKIVLVNFTATWCGPCKQELPELIQIYDEYHNKGLEVISVFLDSDKEKVEGHIRDHKIPWPYSFDGKGWDNKSAREWGISGVPTNSIVDREGNIAIDNVRGATLRSKLDQLLK